MEQSLRVCWVADFSWKTRMGGAQLTNKYVIEEGRERGHVIDEVGLWNLTECDKYLSGYDVYIINNYAEIIRYKVGWDFVEYIRKNRAYVKYAHDYDYLPGQTEAEREFQEKLYKGALLVGCLSPLHLEELGNAFNLKRTFIAAPFIDTDLFKDRKCQRVANSVIALGEVAEHKGIYNLMKWAVEHKDKMIDFFAIGKAEFTYNNLLVNPAIPYDLVPLYLNIYESFIHLPAWKEPFGRTVAEAYLSGCKLITNEFVGFQSFKVKSYKDAELLVTSGPGAFWNNVRAII